VDSVTALCVTFNSRFAVSEHVTKVHALVCFTHSVFYVHMACLPFRCMTFFAQQLSPNFFTVHQRGLDSVLQQTCPDLRRFLSGVNGSVIVRTIFQLFLNFSRTQMTNFFSRISHIQTHVLKPLLPANTQHSYNLRDRSHNYSLITKDSHINDRHFIVRLLYKHSY